MKASVLKLSLAGRRNYGGESVHRFGDEDKALSAMMTAVLWQIVRDYLWMLGNGMVCEEEAFRLSERGRRFGVKMHHGQEVITNGEHTQGQSPGGASGMRELMHLLGTPGNPTLAMICEFTTFHASRIVAKLREVHARFVRHERSIEAMVRKMQSSAGAGLEEMVEVFRARDGVNPPARGIHPSPFDPRPSTLHRKEAA